MVANSYVLDMIGTEDSICSENGVPRPKLVAKGTIVAISAACIRLLDNNRFSYEINKENTAC